MAYNKFITADGLVLLDLTADTVTANKLPKGITAHDRSGTPIIGTAEAAGGSADSAIPIEVSTEAEMTELLESGEVGGVYKYTGTTGTYENGALYVLEEGTVASYSITVNNNMPHYEAHSDNPTQIKEGETVTLTFSSSELYSATASATNATCTYSTKAASPGRVLTVTLSNATDNVVVTLNPEGDLPPV